MRLLLLLVGLAAFAGASRDALKVKYQWKLMDFDWPEDRDYKNLFPDYKREDNLPLGLEVAGDRLFVTIPRWKRGVAATLAYINLNDTRESPPLKPYPSWDSHRIEDRRVPDVISTFRVRADKCDRLWVLDTGLNDITGTNPQPLAPPTLVVYNLRDDTVMRKFAIPEDQRTQDSFFANIAVEDYDCEDSYAYLGDLGGPGVVVYSWRINKSWLIKNDFFKHDEKAGHFNVSGITFKWQDGVFGLALEPTNDGYSNLYFHPFVSYQEYSINTRFLRDNRLRSSEISKEFKQLGTRGANGQSGASFFDARNGILFYTLPNMNGIACWAAGNDYDGSQQGHAYVDDVTMVFPNDIKVDREGNIWVLSDRLPKFMYAQLDASDYNFRIFKGSASELVSNTVCSTKDRVKSRFNDNDTSNNNNMRETGRSAGDRGVLSAVAFAIALLASVKLF